MKRLISLVLLLILSNSYAYLIGGRLAKKSELKSAVYINNNCTATKIGDQFFLTAAHCVYDYQNGLIRDAYFIGSHLTIQTHYGVDKVLTIVKSFPHYSFVSWVEEKLKQKRPTHNAALESYDIALIKVEESTPSIPVADISSDKIKTNKSVFIGGYGCENGKWKRPETPNLKIAVTKTVDQVKYDYSGRNLNQAFYYNFYTKGLLLDFKTASLCPGDSGGGVFLNGKVIGVNSQYIFKDRSGISLVNLHTRLDDIQDWILKTLDY